MSTLKRAADKLLEQQEAVRERDPEDVADAWGDGTSALEGMSRSDIGDAGTVETATTSRLRGIDEAFERGVYAGKVVHHHKSSEDESGSSVDDSDEDDAHLRAALAAGMQGAGFDSDEEDEDEEEDEGVGSGVGDRVVGRKRSRDAILAFEEEDAKGMMALSRSAARDPARGRVVRRQVESVVRLASARVFLQKAVDAANQLPLNGSVLRAKTSTTGVRQASKRARVATAGLCAELLRAHRVAAVADPSLHARVKLLDGMVEEDGSEDVMESKLLPHWYAREEGEGRLGATSKAMDALWATVVPWLEASADAEFARVSVASATSARDVKALGKPPTEEAKAVVGDDDRFHRRANLQQGVVKHVGGGEDDGEWDEETYDDGELLHAMAKEVRKAGARSERKDGSLLASLPSTKPKDKKKKRVYPSTPPSQRINYSIQDPIVNFLAPVPVQKPPHYIDTLVRSVFQE